MVGWRHPVRIVPLAFLLVVTIGTALLMLPVSRTEGSPANLLAAAFTSVSATCVTGLTVVDTATYWTPFGQAVILGLIQIGGFGVMSLATFVAVAVFGRLGLRGSLVAQTDSHASTLGTVRSTLTTVAAAMFTLEGLVAAFLTVRFYTAYDQGEPLLALWHGVFHAVSAFNNAGFALYTDNLMGFVGDGLIIMPICAAVIAGGIGFPVYHELLRRWRRPNTWSVHLRITVAGYFALLTISLVAFAIAEWNNPGTLGGLDANGKVFGTVMGGVTPRTAGFNSIDYGQAAPETLLVNSLMMFIGGGSAGTAGGIKVGTFLLLAFVIWAEVRGEPQVVVGHRAISPDAIRQALTVALLSVAAVAVGTIALLDTSAFPLEKVLFEAASAFGTTGLSAGITAQLTPFGQIVLMALMLVGRLGPAGAATALALNAQHRHYRLPEERPIVG